MTKWWFVVCAAVTHPRSALAVANTLWQWKRGRITERPCRGLAFVLPWKWWEDSYIDPWTKKDVGRTCMERIVTFFLDPKYGDVMFDTFHSPYADKPSWTANRSRNTTLKEGEQFSVAP